MDILQNKMQNRVSSVQERVVENVDTANEYFKKELGGLKGLGSAKVIHFIRKRKILIISFLFVAAIGYGVYGKYFNLTEAERAQKELAKAVATVGKLMVLPEDDEPVLATVTDAETLQKQQAFFTGAINGDQLLLFPKNMKAVIYSSSRNKIINAGPIEQQPSVAASKSEIRNPEVRSSADYGAGLKSETPSQFSQNLDAVGQADSNVSSFALPSRNASDGHGEVTTAGRQSALTVEVRNGTGKSGLAAQMAENVRAAGFEVAAVTDAKNKNYSKTIAVSRAKAGSLAPLELSLLTGLTTQIGAQLIADIPDGEKNTDADVLIILGGE